MTTLATLVLSPKHVYPGHPEEPDRLSQVKTDRAGVDWVTPKPALPEEIARVHTKELVEGIRQVCEREPGIIDYAPTYVTSTSYDDSLLAAGGTLELTRKVMDGEARTALPSSARRGTTPNRSARWDSASSTTSPSPRRMRSSAARSAC